MLAIFLKYPTAGQVKTRIAQSTSAQTAARVYKNLAEDVVNELADFKPTLFYAGCSLKEINLWLPSLKYEKQSEGSLGERLNQASKSHSYEHSPLIIIGTDCIEVTSDTIEKTIKYLETNDLVIGPANDGGYYLIAMKSHYPQLFQDIDWSTEKVLKQTLAQANKLDLSYKLLSIKQDIDYWNQVPNKYKKLSEYKQ